MYTQLNSTLTAISAGKYIQKPPPDFKTLQENRLDHVLSDLSTLPPYGTYPHTLRNCSAKQSLVYVFKRFVIFLARNGENSGHLNRFAATPTIHLW